MHFDLIDLRLFIHVAEAESLTGGASRACLSTAAASTRIKTLENQLGSRLFYRERKGVQLTPAGNQLLRHARTILRQVEHVKSEFSGLTNDGIGHLRIFANTTAVTEFMPEVLSQFLAERPGITIDLEERMTRDIVRGVQEGAADLGVVAGFIASKDLEVIPFSYDRLVIVTPLGHPLAAHSHVTFEQTLAYQHVSLHEGSTLLQFLQDQVNALDRTLPLRIKVFGFESACRMIEAGVGIGILPKSTALRYQSTQKLALVELGEDWAQRQRSMIIRELEALPSFGQDLVQAIAAHEAFTAIEDRTDGTTHCASQTSRHASQPSKGNPAPFTNDHPPII